MTIKFNEHEIASILGNYVYEKYKTKANNIYFEMDARNKVLTATLDLKEQK